MVHVVLTVPGECLHVIISRSIWLWRLRSIWRLDYKGASKIVLELRFYGAFPAKCVPVHFYVTVIVNNAIMK